MNSDSKNKNKIDLITFEDVDQIEDYSKQNKRIIVIYQGKVCDVTEFVSVHPGGDVIEEYNLYDIEEAFNSKKIHQHTNNALRILLDYQIGILNQQDSDVEDQQTQLKNEQENNQQLKHIIKFRGFDLNLKKFLVPQINSLTQIQYSELLSNPYHNSEVQYILSDNQIINTIFRNNYKQFKIQFLLLMVLWMILGKKVEIQIAAFLVLSGIFYWTLIEYLIQRLFFKLYKFIPDITILRVIHFLTFGQHVVFPQKLSSTSWPILFIVCLFALSLKIFTLISIQTAYIKYILFGKMIGFFSCEVIHYLIHQRSVRENNYLINQENFHIEHHEKHYTCNYGITNKIWDYIFFSYNK